MKIKWEFYDEEFDVDIPPVNVNEFVHIKGILYYWNPLYKKFIPKYMNYIGYIEKIYKSSDKSSIPYKGWVFKVYNHRIWFEYDEKSFRSI